MTPHDFNSAFENLLARGLPPPPDPTAVARAVVRRDTVRTRVLAVLAVVFWLAAGAGMLVLLYGLNELVIFIRIADWDNASSLVSQSPSPYAVPTTAPVAPPPTTAPVGGACGVPAGAPAGPVVVVGGRSTTLSAWQRQMLRGTSYIHHAIPWVAGSVGALMLAAVFTVMLVLSSRRGVLNRINISLQQISEQLHELRRPAAAGAAGHGPAA